MLGERLLWCRRGQLDERCPKCEPYDERNIAERNESFVLLHLPHQEKAAYARDERQYFEEYCTHGYFFVHFTLLSVVDRNIRDNVFIA